MLVAPVARNFAPLAKAVSIDSGSAVLVMDALDMRDTSFDPPSFASTYRYQPTGNCNIYIRRDILKGIVYLVSSKLVGDATGGHFVMLTLWCLC